MMKKIFLLLVVVAFSSTLFSQTLNLKDITEGKFRPKGIEPTVSSTDGEFFFQANPEQTKIIKYSYKTGQPVETIFDVTTARESNLSHFDGFLMSPDENRLLVYVNATPIYRRSFEAEYYYFDIRRNLLQKLTNNPGKQKSPVFSKDGRMLAYVTDNNIWLSKFDYGTESQVTKDGKLGEVINGATDWVYEEEFGVTTLMDFSPDNKLLAFVRFDETNVPTFSFQKFDGQLYPTLQSFKYPKAGETNSKVTCNVFDIESKTTRKMNIYTDGDNIEYIPRILFAPNSQLAVMTLNRDQNDFKMFFSDPRSTVSKLILRDKNDRYVDSENLNSIHFLGDQFTYLSEKDGYNHIYLYSLTGVEQKQLTKGSYDVTEILETDGNKTIFFQSAEDSPLQRSIYKIDTEKGTKNKLSQKVGYNAASFSNNGKYYINYWSNSSTPTVVTLNDGGGKELRVLQDNKTLAKVASSLPQKEYIKIKVPNGPELNAWVMKPSDFNPNKKYPLLMIQYSGPNSQQVLDKFTVDWETYLVTQGYIVACVDGRGTGARGEEFRKSTYMNLGIQESDDQIEAAKYFASLPYINPSEISIWGWSYGGYNVLMAMSRGNGIFKSGIAIAPVTDWRLYDSVYTERFMRTPQQNPRGYNASSAINLANNLEGKLLLIHGSADDNVHYQNSMEYASALIKAGKDFDMITFPDLNHSLLGSKNRTFLYEKIIKFLKSNN